LDVYLIDESKNYTIQFPVNPLNKLSNPKEKRYTTADIIDFGEVDISQNGSKIIEISFDSFFPKEYDTYCQYTAISTPQEYINVIQFWMDSDTHVRLIITDLNINELVNISKFAPEVRSGEIGDIYFSITFRTYRELKIETVNDSSNYSGGLQNNRSNTYSNEYKDGDKVKVTASALNVRKGCGTSYEVIGCVSKETVLTIYRQQGNWADCYYGNHGGCICLDYVTRA
jgi:hypothetical protein